MCGRCDGIFACCPGRACARSLSARQRRLIGEYYTGHGGTGNKCPRAKCTNALVGTKYTGFGRSRRDTTNKCATENCVNAVMGYFLSGTGVCTQSKCTTAKVGEYYPGHDGTYGTGDKCPTAKCTNAWVDTKSTLVSVMTRTSVPLTRVRTLLRDISRPGRACARSLSARQRCERRLASTTQDTAALVTTSVRQQNTRLLWLMRKTPRRINTAGAAAMRERLGRARWPTHDEDNLNLYV